MHMTYRPEWKRRLYFGITGFTRTTEVTFALAHLNRACKRLFMVGVVASWRSLRNQEVSEKWRSQVPHYEDLPYLFLGDPQVLNLVHYSTLPDQPQDLYMDMAKIHHYAGPFFHGFQLNIPWPSPQAIEAYRRSFGDRTTIILQVGQAAFDKVVGDSCANPGRQVAYQLSDYKGLIDGILYDMSGGNGKLVDTTVAVEHLAFIAKHSNWLQCGVAGGACAETLRSNFLPLMEQLGFPLNFDAQDRMRSADRIFMDEYAVAGFMSTAQDIIAEVG